MILYVDTFISETPLSPNVALEKLLKDVQNSAYTYRKQSKIDILRYSLVSYASIKWDKVIFRIDGENRKKLSALKPFINELFPSSDIKFERSDTGVKFTNNLTQLNVDNKNPWIFFSPNNDHPFIGKDPKIFTELIADAEVAEDKYNLPVSILYSHFTESINSIKKTNYLYGYTGEFGEILEESSSTFTVKFKQLSLLSLQIYRANFLIDAMKRAGNSRVVRTECLGQYLPYNQESIVIIPKNELCRHYDGYFHTYSVVDDYVKASYCPPLLIPDGFFEKKIKIKYGYDKYYKGYLNVNPNAQHYIFENIRGTDIAVNKSDFPFFWLDRIESLDTNPCFQKISQDNQSLIRNVENPWRTYSRLHVFYIISCRRLYYFFRLNRMKVLLVKSAGFIIRLIKNLRKLC